MRTNQANQPTKTTLFWYIFGFDDMMLDVLAHGIFGIDPSTELSWVLESMLFIAAKVTDGQTCGVFRGARNLYLLTLCMHSDQVLKESWMAKLATCIYDDSVDFWILAVWFSTFSILTCHINNKKQCGRWPWVVSCCPPWHWFIIGPIQKMSLFWGVDSIPAVVLGEFVCCNCFRPGHQSHGRGSGIPRFLLKKAPTSLSQAQHVLFSFLKRLDIEILLVPKSLVHRFIDTKVRSRCM